jgi:hypothetical protein
VIAIYGPSERTVEVLEALSVAPERVFSTSGGGYFLGLPIEPSSAIDDGISRLIITTSYYPQVVAHLQNLGFPVEKIEIHYHDGLDGISHVKLDDVLAMRDEFEQRDQIFATLAKKFPGNDAPLVVDRDQFRVESVLAPTVEGLNLEFGTYRGESIRTFAPHVDTIYGFDTFSGLPLDWTISRPQGTIDAGGLPDVPNNVVLIQGTFEDSLPMWLENGL